MNKKISTEIAVGIILFIAVIIGGSIWLGNKEIKSSTIPISQEYNNSTQNLSQSQKSQNEESIAYEIGTEKENYEYEELISLEITRNDFPSERQSYFELHGCKLVILKGNALKKGDDKRNHDVSDREIFSTDISDIEKGQSRIINAPSLAPDDYYAQVRCELLDHRGSDWEGIVHKTSYSEYKDFTVNEPVICKEKKIEIKEVFYDSNNDIILKVKNAGTKDVFNLGIYMVDQCKRKDNVFISARLLLADNTNITKKEVGESDDIQGLRVGEAKEYKIVPKENDYNCRFGKIAVRISECYDGNPETWSVSEISQI